MFKKLYPADQVQKYLLIDVIAIVFLFYFVMAEDRTLHIGSSVVLLLVFLVSFYICLWHRDFRQVIFSYVGYIALIILASTTKEWVLLYGFMFADLLGRAKSKWHMVLGLSLIHI